MNFDQNGEIEEAGTMEESSSPIWWVNSGGLMTIKNSIASTIQGELPVFSHWRVIYNKDNPSETDNGTHPQNIFRLVTRTKWQNLQQEAYYKITKYNLSADSHRDASNGLLLFNRYQDGNNLYYTGIRVDGTVVIKKKI